ncbi:MAG: hypothetical protein II776_06870 [Clostridia bacterium]|nr:hypothetical protein [Clostridia bacterium]
MKKKQEIPEEIRAAGNGAEAVTEEQTAEAAAAEAPVPAEGENAAASGEEPEEKLSRDVAAFHELFPDVKADAIPREVWEEVEKGAALTAAYAVHFVREMREKERIARISAENEKAAPPRVRHDGTDGDYFSPEAVRAMSRQEVRKHYSEILRSMDHWN